MVFLKRLIREINKQKKEFKKITALRMHKTTQTILEYEVGNRLALITGNFPLPSMRETQIMEINIYLSSLIPVYDVHFIYEREGSTVVTLLEDNEPDPILEAMNTQTKDPHQEDKDYDRLYGDGSYTEHDDLKEETKEDDGPPNLRVVELCQFCAHYSTYYYSVKGGIREVLEEQCLRYDKNVRGCFVCDDFKERYKGEEDMSEEEELKREKEILAMDETIRREMENEEREY